MIGFFNVSVILTYVGLLTAVFGIFQAGQGNIAAAIFCLLFCGLCDMFDGKIARAIQRTEDEKAFGIQIDSLCDLVCFGVFPAVIGWSMGSGEVWQVAAFSIYVLAAVIRLGYFNVTEANRQKTTDANRSVYQGLPVTSIAVLLPVFYLFRKLMGEKMGVFAAVYLFVVGCLFILNFKVRKPHGKTTYVLIAVGALVCAALIISLLHG